MSLQVSSLIGEKSPNLVTLYLSIVLSDQQPKTNLKNSKIPRIPNMCLFI